MRKETFNSKILFEFQQGLSAGIDPINSKQNDTGKAITTIHSHWLNLHCSKCGHSFRNGDIVVIMEDGTVYHETPLLPCASGSPPIINESDLLDQFYAGIETTYPPLKIAPVTRLEKGHFLISDPTPGFRRYECSVCGHTLRLYDIVVICPCNPEDPKCRIAIHNDPIKGLNCWGEWKPKQYTLHCPATSKKL